MSRLIRRVASLLLFLMVFPTADLAAQTLGRQRVNTWAARSSSGQTFGGTFTATEDAKTGAVTGSWTLLDAQGRQLATGGWSAAKSPSGWNGSWRAVATGRAGEYAGTWRASVTLKPGAGFAALFAEAVKQAVSGSWQSGGRSGSWSIRVTAPPAASSSPPAVPPELLALTAASRLDGTVTAWCRAGFRPAQANAFAAAMTSAAGGRYVALEPGAPVIELGRFTRRADLACYTRAQAEDLDKSIRQSSTIHGQIVPRFNTTVVCGFLEDTVAECWQYSPDDRAFVKVGGWTT
jgi:hypothetical protein